MTHGCLRSRYEAAVPALRAQVAVMRGDGTSSETIARVVHAERRRLPFMTQHFTPLPFTRNVNDLPQAGAITTSVGCPSIRDMSESYEPRPQSSGGLQLLRGHAAALPVSARIARSMIRQ